MNAKLFYILNLFACMGIGACNGININRMDKDKGSNVPGNSGIGFESGTSSRSNVSSPEQISLRKRYVDILSEMANEQLGTHLPVAYKNFLVENPSPILNGKDLGSFDIFSFKTSSCSNEKEEVLSIKTNLEPLMRYQIGLVGSISIQEDLIEGISIKKPWCIAVYSEEYSREYYYIDLVDPLLRIYKQDKYGKITSAHKRLNEFVEFCKGEHKRIIRSLEETRKSTS